MSSLHAGRAIATVVLFERVGDSTYRIGPEGDPAYWEPRSNGMAGGAMAQALAAERGLRVRLTHLMPARQDESERSNPRRCAWNIIKRAIAQIGYTSPLLEAALQDFELWTERSADGRIDVFGRLKRRGNSVVIRT